MRNSNKGVRVKPKAIMRILLTLLLVYMVSVSFAIALITAKPDVDNAKPFRNETLSNSVDSHNNFEKSSSNYESFEDIYGHAISQSIRGRKQHSIPFRDVVGTKINKRSTGPLLELDILTGSFESVTVEFGNAQWHVIICNNTKNLNVYGEPTVPYKKTLVPLEDAEIISVAVEEELIKEISGVKLLPGLKPLPLGVNRFGWSSPRSYFEKNFYADPLIYCSDQEFPSDTVRSDVVTFRGEKFLSLTIFPFKFCPEGSILRAFDVHVKVEFTKPVSSLTRQLSINSVEEEDPGYVIITPSEFSEAANSFAEWKEQLGFSVQKTTLEFIYDNFYGRDKPEKVREFINQSYTANGTEYYLLVGDCDVCPVREVWDPVNLTGTGLENGTEPSDLYYECLDGDWDENGNSVFGEPEDDVDFYPEVKVGRLPVSTAEDVARVCGKIRRIEENPEPGDWIKQFLLIAPTAFTPGDSAAALEEEVYKRFLADSFFDVRRLYDVDYSLTPSAVISAMNQGVGLVDFFDHGAYDQWVGALYTSEALNLNNGNKTFLAFAMACETAAFDYQEYITIAEAFFRNPNGGAIGYIGATRIALAGYDCFDGLHHRFWKYFLAEATTQLEANPKEALQAATVEMVSTYDVSGPTRETIYQAIYFGDPALNLCWKHNVTTAATPDLETNKPGVVNGTCQLLHSGIPITGEYQVAIKDPANKIVVQKSGTLGNTGNYTINFTTSAVPGNYTIQTNVTNPFSYIHTSTFTVGVLNITVNLDSSPVYGDPVQVSGQVLEDGNPISGEANVSIIDEGTIVRSKIAAVNASGHYQTEINITTFGTQTLHIWASNVNDTKHGGSSVTFKVKRGDILIIADDSGELPIYPGGWYDLNKGSSTSYHSFYRALRDDYNVSVYRLIFDLVPELTLLQQYSAVIVTCGDHYGVCLTNPLCSLTELLTKYHNSRGDLILEGGDLAYSLNTTGYETFMQSVLHIDFTQDMDNFDLSLNNTLSHPVTQGLPPEIPLIGGLGSPSVDMISPMNGSEIASRYVKNSGSSIVAFSGNSGLGSVVYFSFSIDGIADYEYRDKLIKNSVGFALYPTLTVELSDYAFQENASETIWVHVSDSDTGQPIENATVTFAGCGVAAQNTTDNSGECSVFVDPTKVGIINVTVQKTGYLNFTTQIVIYSRPRLTARITPEALKKKAQKVDVSVTDFYEHTAVAYANVTLVGCGVFETDYTNSTGGAQFTVTPTSYGRIRMNVSKHGYENYTALIDVYVKAVVVDSFATDYPTESSWDDLNSIWQNYGAIPIRVDAASLNKYGINYEDLVESEAEVLIISCAAMIPREYTDDEISAIKRYTLEGHGLIATAGTLYQFTPNNNKLALLFGMREDIDYDATYMETPSLNILAPQHPLFINISSPYPVGYPATACPSDYSWDPEDLFGGVYVAMSDAEESAIIVYNGVAFIAHFVEYMSSSYDLQLMYNAIVWSKYEVPEHDMAVTSLDTPLYLEPNEAATINTTVSNFGLNNESDVTVQFFVNGNMTSFELITTIESQASVDLGFPWIAPKTEGKYNITIYVQPVPAETTLANNVATKFVSVFTIRNKILLVVDDDGDIHMDSGVWPDEIESALADSGFQVFVWSEKEMGRPSLNLLLNSLGVVWHCGTYWAGVVDDIDAEMLIQFVQAGGSLVLEGGQIAFEHGWDDFMVEVAHATFGVMRAGDSLTVTAPTHPVTTGLPSQLSTKELFPDGVYPTMGGKEVVKYADTAYSGVVVFNSTAIRTVYISFSLHYLSPSIRNQLIVNSVNYITLKDDILPTISITNPEDYTLTNSTSVDVSWYGSDNESGIDHYSVFLNEKFLLNTTKSSYMLSNLTEGPNNVTIVAYDNADNHASDQIAVIVDLTPPAAEIVAPENESYLKDAVLVIVNVSDPHFDYMKLYINDTLAATFNDDGPNIHTWKTIFIEDGTFTIKLTVYDKAGNHAKNSVVVHVDNTSPDVNWTSPSNGSYVAGTANLTFSYDDPNLCEATLLLDGKTLANVTGKIFYLWNTAGVADGEHILKVKVLDRAGNGNTTLPITVTVDNTVPIAELLTSKEGEIIGGMYNLSFRCYDTNLKNATLKIAAAAYDVTNTTWFSLNTTELPDGNHTFMLIVVDRAGNSANEAVMVTVDNIPPEVSITNSVELNGTEQTGILTIEFNASDPHLVSVFLHIDEALFNVTGWASYEWDTAMVGDGTHVVEIVATDKAGNVGKAQIVVTTKNVEGATERSYASGRNLGLIVGASVGLSIGAVITFVIVKKVLSKRKETVSS